MSDGRVALRTFFLETLKIDALNESEDLVESGQLDSLALVELLFFLEDRFGIRVDVEQLDLDELRSLDAIGRMIERDRPTAGGDR